MEPIDVDLELPGLMMHYRTWGSSDDPAIVLLHGMLLHGRWYDEIAKPLATSHYVVLPDLRGHGRSSWVGDYSWRRWVEDVEGLVDTLGFERFDLVGHSHGAAVATQYAGLHPTRVTHLVLLDGGFGPPNSPEYDDWFGRVVAMNPIEGFDSHEELVATRLRIFPRSERQVFDGLQDLDVTDDQGRVHTTASDFEAVAGDGPSDEELEQLRRQVLCPTLVVRSELSELFSGDAYQEVACTFAQGSAMLLPGVGHNVHAERTRATADLAASFVQ
jgi:esterase